MKKIIVSVFALSLTLQTIPAASLAQTASTTTLQAQIQALLQQIKSLNDQIASIQQQKQSTVAALLTTLKQGSRGEGVKTLQALLAADPAIYPEGTISGYYGQLTAQAVKRLQKKHGLEQIGSVGPKTLKKLNEMLDENPLAFESTSTTSGASSTFNIGSGVLCAKVPPGHLIAPGWLRKHGGVQPIVPLCQTLPPGIVGNPNYPGVTPTSTATSTPDTTPPIISNVAASSTVNSATVTWATNESADSRIAYGTSTVYGSLTALNPALVTSHSELISGLSPSTLYHYEVLSRDAAGNLAASTSQTFTTLVMPDTTPPVISSVLVSPVSTSSVVSWNTNEPASPKVYYSTANPVDVNATSTASVSNSTLVNAHALTLAGLNSTTTYFFVVQSADAANNVATSSGSFTTTQ
jgi:peptidoglycan hydrolase-like protein with peptidoglycan-binding domain